MNNEIKEYFNDEDKNFSSIMQRIDKKKKNKKIFMNTLVIIFVLLFISGTTPQIYAKIKLNKEYEEYTRRDYVSGKGIIGQSYSQKTDMDYIYKNDIGIKVDDFALTDDKLAIDFNVIIPEELLFEKEYENMQLQFSYIIYDEKNNIYIDSCNITRAKLDMEKANILVEQFNNYKKCLFKELGIKQGLFKREWEYDVLSNSGGYSTEYYDENIKNNFKISFDLKTYEGFPNSEKIYIRIFDLSLNAYEEDMIVKELDNAEWKIELESPDRFLKRDSYHCSLSDNIDGLKVEKFTISETGCVFVGNMSEVVDKFAEGKDMQGNDWSKVSEALFNITDAQGNVYYPVFGGTTIEKNGFFHMFEIDKDLANSTTLYLNMKIDEDEYTREIYLNNEVNLN